MKISILMLAVLCFIMSLTSTGVMAEVAGITTGEQLQKQAESKTQVIDTEGLKTMLAEELDMVLIDIRTPGEIKSMGGTIKADQNVNMPRGWLEFRVTRVALSKDVPIVVYCGAGIRSPLAAETLQNMGYTNVKDYSEGYMGWKNASLPIKQ